MCVCVVQVCNLMWSKNVNEIVSTHGYSLNQVIVWKYPSMQKIATLTGHTLRYALVQYIVLCRLALPCLALPCLALPCLALPCLALPCLALPCLALPCLALPCLAFCYIYLLFRFLLWRLTLHVIVVTVRIILSFSPIIITFYDLSHLQCALSRNITWRTEHCNRSWRWIITVSTSAYCKYSSSTSVTVWQTERQTHSDEEMGRQSD